MISKKTLNTLLVSAIAVGVVGASTAALAQDSEKEKCYGVVKAGKNDCAAAGGSHSCAGHAAADATGDEWVALPKGVCEKLVNGSLTPAGAPAAEAPAAEAPAEGAAH